MLLAAALALLDESSDTVTDVQRMIHIGLLIGFGVWVGRVAEERSALLNAQNSARWASELDARRADQSPAPFVKRLAQYMECDEAELSTPRPKPKSKMKFWSLVDFGTWHGPKPAVVIKRILRRIQETVHGAQHRR